MNYHADKLTMELASEQLTVVG